MNCPAGGATTGRRPAGREELAHCVKEAKGTRPWFWARAKSEGQRVGVGPRAH